MPEISFHTTFLDNHFLLSRAKNGSKSGMRSAVSYRFGFNGKENDNEVKGTGNSVDFGARIYDPRIGRWLSLDPQFKSQPGWSPYKAFLDNPLMFADPDGGTEYVTIVINDERTGTTIVIRKAVSNELFTDNKIHERSVTQATLRDYMYWYDKETTTTITIPKDGGTPIVNTTSGFGRKRAETYAPFNCKEVAKSLVTGHEGYGGENRGGIYFTTSSGGASPTKFKSLSDATKEDAEGLLTMLSYASGFAPPEFGLSEQIDKIKSLTEEVTGGDNSNNGGDTKPGTSTVGVSNVEPNSTNPTDSFERPARVMGFDGTVKKETIRRYSYDDGGSREL
ncbi:MAG: RHS repeat-associated core domain-containing protein [Bacteroidales bacterium]